MSGGKDEDDFGSDGEENGAAESVDDANAMGEFWVFSRPPCLCAICSPDINVFCIYPTFSPYLPSALAVEATKKFLSENSDASPSAIAEKVVNEQMASGLKSQDKIHIFISAAFTPDFFKHKQVEKNAATIAKITQGKNVMERHLISACEGLCADKPKNFAVLIKQVSQSLNLSYSIHLHFL